MCCVLIIFPFSSYEDGPVGSKMSLFLFFFLVVFAVSKSLLPPANIARFVNFVSPNTSEHDASTINFQHLSDICVESIGLFGTKKEVCRMLLKFGFADSDLYVFIVDISTRKVEI